jgi:AraC-like DNA-binding protein
MEVKRRSAPSVLCAIEDWPQRARAAKYHVANLARRCGVRRRALERFFRDTLTMSPQQWLDQIRQIDAEVLARSDKTTKEIAVLLGYKQPSHFCRRFKNARGISATVWKKAAAKFYGFFPSPSPENPPTEVRTDKTLCR